MVGLQKPMNTSYGLRIRLLVLGLAILLPVLALLSYQHWYYTQQRLVDETRHATDLTALLGEKAELHFARYRVMLNTLARLPVLQGGALDADTCRKILGKLPQPATHGATDDLTLYAADGHPVCSTTPHSPAEALPVLSDETSFREAMQQRHLTFSDLVAGSKTVPAHLLLIQPLFDETTSGGAHHALVARLDLTRLDSDLKLPFAPAQTNLVLTSRHGVVLSPAHWRGRQIGEHPLFQRIIAQPEAAAFRAPGIDGVERVIAPRPLHPAPNEVVYLWSALPRIDLYGTASRLFNATLLTLGVILMLLLAAWLLNRRWVLKPIDQLRQSAERIGQGNFATRTGLPHSQDEIGLLAASIDDMAATLEKSEHWRDLVLDAANLGAWDIDLVKGTTYRSARHNEIFGYGHPILTADALDFFRHVLPEDLDYVKQCYADALASGRHFMEVRILRTDGELRWISVRGQVLYDDQRRPIRMVGVLADITERKLTEAQQQRQNRTLRLLSETNEALLRTRDEGELFETVCRQITDIGGYPLAWVGFAVEDDDKTILPVAQSGTEGFVSRLQLTWADTPHGNGPTGLAVRQGKPIIVQNTQQDPLFEPWRQLAADCHFFSTLSLPLHNGSNVMGVLSIYARETYAFDNSEVIFLEKLANNLAYGIVHLREIHKREYFEQQLDYQAHYDRSTGLPNRALFMERLNQAIATAQEARQPIAVLVLDLDRFKNFNDTLGHDVGDQLLQQVAQRLARNVHDNHLIGRLSVDEFGIIVNGFGKTSDVMDYATPLLQTIAKPVILAGRQFYITASAGIGIYPDSGESADVLLQAAYAAMYGAKAKGGNNCQLYVTDMSRHLPKRLMLDAALRQAIDNNQLQVHFQPKVSLENGEIVGAEALLRWSHPEMGMVSPVEFIPLAEETGLIISIGEWVIDATCRQMRTWLDAGLAVPPTAINLSARQFGQENLTAMIRRILTTHRLDPELLVLEITESTAMFDVEKAINILGELKQIGVKISLDDFGTGYSSLSYLKRLPLDHLKIDRAFVNDITHDPDDAAICVAVIGLGHNLKMTVVAEGVETTEQMHFLRQHRCNEMQGYLFSRPVPPTDYASMLANGKSQKL